MITCTIRGFRNFLTINKDNHTYTVSLSSYNSILQKIGFYKSESTKELIICFKNNPLQNIFDSPNIQRQEDIYEVKQYLKKRLKSCSWTTADLGGPELRFNKLKIGSELLDYLYTDTDNDSLVEYLFSLHEKACELEEIGYGYSYAGGELGKVLIKLLCKYDNDFEKRYQNASSKMAHMRAQTGHANFL